MHTPVYATLLLLLASVPFAQRQASMPGELQRVRLIDGAQSVEMRDSVASRKSHLGVPSSKQYFIFDGPKALIRTRNATPVIQFDLEPEYDDEVYLFKFDKHSDSREIRVAKGLGSLAELSIPKDHLIPSTLEQIGAGKNSAKRYRLKPNAPLRPGEYCLSRNLSDCFDFGVD